MKVMNQIRLWCVLSLLAVLAGCASKPAVKENLTPAALEKVWQDNKKRALALDVWQVRGRAGVKTAERSGVVSISWEQQPDAYSIYMTGPLGRTLARIEKEKNAVTLDIPGKEPVRSDSAEKLLHQQTGWWLPFSALGYWMRGIPEPGSDYVRVLNDQGNLAELRQNGWKIVYGGYQEVSGIFLPERVRAEKNGVSVVLSIRSWNLARLKKQPSKS